MAGRSRSGTFRDVHRGQPSVPAPRHRPGGVRRNRAASLRTGYAAPAARVHGPPRERRGVLPFPGEQRQRGRPDFEVDSVDPDGLERVSTSLVRVYRARGVPYGVLPVPAPVWEPAIAWSPRL